jgi:Kelch motif
MESGQTTVIPPAAVPQCDSSRLVPLHYGRTRCERLHLRGAPLQSGLVTTFGLFLYAIDRSLSPAVSLQYETRPTRGKAPSPRGYHAAILADSRLFVFGGFNGHVVYDDVYILDLAAAAYLPQVTSFKIQG